MRDPRNIIINLSISYGFHVHFFIKFKLHTGTYSLVYHHHYLFYIKNRNLNTILASSPLRVVKLFIYTKHQLYPSCVNHIRVYFPFRCEMIKNYHRARQNLLCMLYKSFLYDSLITVFRTTRNGCYLWNKYF